MRVTLPRDTMTILSDRVKAHGARETARVAGVSTGCIERALAGKKVTSRVAYALRRVPPKIRKAEDFVRAPAVRPPRPRDTSLSWSVELIRAALEDQFRGDFRVPKRLAEAMRRDDAIFAARANRLAPISAVESLIKAHDSDRGRAVAAKARVSVQVARTVLAGIAATLVDHGIAIGYVEHTPTPDGTRIDMRLTEWPLEHVRHNASTESLETATDAGVTVPITHGDGRWIVFRSYAFMPWRENACLLPAGFIWAAHAGAMAYWQASSKAHGSSKIHGTMPEGNALNDDDGAPTDAVAEFEESLRRMAEGESIVAVTPFGSQVQFLADTSNAWQIFAENIGSREKAAARVYNGTDAMLGSVGGAPGVDISALFNVATTKLQGDFTAIQDGLRTGLYEPWAAMNYGSTWYAPRWEFLMPDPDIQKRREENSANRTMLHDAIKAMREQRLEVTQEVIATLSAEFGVSPAPALAAIDQQTSTITLAPTDAAKSVRVWEARAAQGLPPFGDARDDMLLPELDAWIAERIAKASQREAQ